MRALLLALTVAGCGPDASVSLDATTTQPPAALLVCPAAAPPARVPPLPRGFDSVVRFGRDADASYQQTKLALERCRASLDGLARWVADRGM
jgi:hypothetical protein